MPIEFRCTHCHKLLRTQDGTGGKQAKCPSCGALVPIPIQASPPPLPSVTPQPNRLPAEAPPSAGNDPAPTEPGGMLSTAWGNLRRKIGF